MSQHRWSAAQCVVFLCLCVVLLLCVVRACTCRNTTSRSTARTSRLRSTCTDWTAKRQELPAASFMWPPRARCVKPFALETVKVAMHFLLALARLLTRWPAAQKWVTTMTMMQKMRMKISSQTQTQTRMMKAYTYLRPPHA